MSSNRFPNSSQVVDLTNSPYPYNTKESAIELDTPVLTQVENSHLKKEMSTPPQPTMTSPSSKGSAQKSPFSPSRKLIPPMPVPDNMDIQLKPTIPNSKRKFDINKLAFGGDINSAALDELKSMLESIQNALVNIVERSKGNSSHIQLFGTQLREFNETFKQRQENENDLLTTSTYKSNHELTLKLLQDLKLQLEDINALQSTLDSHQILEMLSKLSGEFQEKLDSYQSINKETISKLSSIESNQLESSKNLQLNSQIDILKNLIEEVKQSLETKQPVSELQSNIDSLHSKMNFKPIVEKLNEIDSKLNVIGENLEAQKAANYKGDIVDALNSMNTEIIKLSKAVHKSPGMEQVLAKLQDTPSFEKILEQNHLLTEKLENYINGTSHLDDRIQQIEKGNIEKNVNYDNEISKLRDELHIKDLKIEELKRQQTEENMTLLEEKLNNLKIQELSEQLRKYQEKEELQLSTNEIINKTIALKTEHLKLETELELKTKLLTQLSSTYNNKLDQLIALSQRFEELKLKTEVSMSSMPDKLLINNVKFDMKYEPTAIPGPSSSSSDFSMRYSGREQRRNVTLNESMLSTANKLLPIDINSYETGDILSGSLPEKRKIVNQAQYNIDGSVYDSGFYNDQLTSPIKKKVHTNDSNKENYE